MKAAAWLWLAITAASALYLGLRVADGLAFRTDLLALLPQEERDPAVQRAKDRMVDLGGRQIVMLLGHADRDRARTAGAELAAALQRSRLFASTTFQLPEDGAAALGRLFFPSRSGLLAEADRRLLAEGRGGEIARRALAAVYSPGAPIDARLLREDPFLLLPGYLAALPPPLPRASADEGVLTLHDGGRTWVVLSAALVGDPFALAVQNEVVGLVDAETTRLLAATPGLEALRAGAVFYAHEAATRALGDMTTIGILSLLGTAALIVVVFRAPRPLLLGALSVCVGIVVAFSACLAWFGDLHIGALLFGVSLIGVAVDYSLHYLCEGFAAEPGGPQARLMRVLPGLALGMGTTLIGYLTLLLSPLPGLHELAVFSAVGIVGAFLTVVLWLPALDRVAVGRAPARLLVAGEGLWRFWEAPERHAARILALAALSLATLAGLAFITVDDDVRRMQRLSPALRLEEEAIQRLTGRAGGGSFVLIRAPNTESSLILEEALLPRLAAARQQGALVGFQAIGQFVPSAARQRENRALVAERLAAPQLAAHLGRLGLPQPAAPTADPPILTPVRLAEAPALAFLSAMTFPIDRGVAHLVPLSGVARPAEVAALADDLPGVVFVDAVADTGRLLGEYRRRAMLLLAGSVLLMLPMLIWRYGVAGAARVAMPPVVALLAAPPLLALVGVPFTFFSAMALVLVLSMGIDYSIFCREAGRDRQGSATLGIWLASLTTILSFGLLAASGVAAARSFGLTLTVGIALSFLLAPLAARRA